MFTKETYTNGDYTLHYGIDFPNNFSPKNKYPILFYFHGMGNVQTGLDNLIETCPIRRELMPEGAPFIVVAPSCDDYTWFENFGEVIKFIKSFLAKEYADENRFYLTGSSMGGYTAWTLSYICPELWAAAVICCGGGLYGGVRDRVKFPIRAVHGTADTTVECRESELMADRINRKGGRVELILLEGFPHDVWTHTFSQHETYQWLLLHKKDC